MGSDQTVIPRRIVQSHRSAEIGHAWRQTWIRHHPDFAYEFYDDAACENFLRGCMPGLLSTYLKLPLPVQKADLFRYAVIYHRGGIYADVDTICLAPLPSYIDMNTTRLIAGIEMSVEDWPFEMDKYVRLFCSPRQVLQWCFAAPPRHAALGRILQRIEFLVSGLTREQLERASTASRFTLELTGPMLFTQVLMELATQHRDAGITLLPRPVWGALPREHNVPEIRARMKLAHLFAGSWKQKGSVVNQAHLAG